jgi:rhodanese-related sulfurtransferase
MSVSRPARTRSAVSWTLAGVALFCVANRATPIGPALNGPALRAMFAAPSGHEQDELAMGGPAPYCGIMALYRALGALGVSVNFAELVDRKYVSSTRGSTPADLLSAAEDLGIHAQTLDYMTCRVLRQCQDPVILHVKAHVAAKAYDHWVLFLGIERGQARICDGSKPLVLMPMNELAAEWDGLGIVLSREPVALSRFRLLSASSPLLWAGGLTLALGLCTTFRFRSRPAGGRRVNALVQAVTLVGAALILGMAYREMPDGGFLSSGSAIRSIQEVNFGKFLPVVSASDVARLRGAPDVTIIDARFAEDYDAGHIPGARSVPVSLSDGEVPRAIAGVPKENRVIVYPHSNGCTYAEVVAKRLYGLGYRSLLLFEDGWLGWQKYQQSTGGAKR